MAIVAKMMAIGMVVAVMLTVTLAVVGGEADAHPSQHPAAFILAKEVFRSVSNDRYGIIHHRLEANGHQPVADVMEHAAVDLCQGTLYEDYSCSGPIAGK